jgi:rod shape-determining protein MreC
MQKSKKKTFIAVSSIIILIIVFHFLGILNPFENFIKSALNLGVAPLYKIGVNINDKQNQSFVCYDLQQELSELKIDRAKLTLLEDENNQLKEQLAFFENKKYDHVGAKVIGKDYELFGNSIILNKGSNDGIEEGDPVIVSNGVLVGKVLKVDETTSVVRLLSDNQSRVAATLTNKDKSIGLIEGGYGISIRMNLIPQNEMINIGDIVITSGLEEKIPRGLLIGSVEAVEKEPYQPFQRAVLTPLSVLEKVFLVSVIIQIQE